MNNVKDNSSSGASSSKKRAAEIEQASRRTRAATRRSRAASEAPPSQVGSFSISAGRDIRLEAGSRLFITNGDIRLVNELADKEGSVADEIAAKSAELTELVKQGKQARSGLDKALINARQALQAEKDAHGTTRMALEASSTDKSVLAVQLKTAEEEIAKSTAAHQADKELLKQLFDQLAIRHAEH
ncbi:hypothetical protein CF327_g7386 [Tilletia walkeri]|uniref:Uncharacterized protein n=1 Tax=Tilletia walkeri TaxID=117179 RepID=A0A8X7T196_9BASI|nr:hypothetical protein CF327_g7386 [Tilletia walkeri]KAE8262133.1 hypothetical protein A4X09_0g7529 [Tilletia walkeri]